MLTVNQEKDKKSREIKILRPFYSGKRDENGKPIIYKVKQVVTLPVSEAAAAVSAEKAVYVEEAKETKGAKANPEGK